MGPHEPDRQTRADPSGEIHHAFWLRHMRIGFGVFLGESLVVMLYLATTPHGIHRPILKVVVVVWFLFAMAGLFAAPRLASRSSRASFSACWTIASILAVGVVAALDGGVDSPTLFLLFLPVGFAALAFTPVVTTACGLFTLATMAVVAITDGTIHLFPEDAFVLIGVLVGAAVLSVAASINRTHREDHERLLSQQVTLLASTDGLTGCAVHRVFHERLEEEIARSVRTNRPLSLVMLDVDDFKAVNDSYGHLVGDSVLASIGAVLRAQTRSFELSGRLGGDEFAVLMPDTEPSAAAVAANRFRQETAKAVEVPVTLSVGVSGFDPSTPTAERMLDDADFALYQVKRAGRDSVIVRHPHMEVPKERHLGAESKI